jgi:hypothetical protein
VAYGNTNFGSWSHSKVVLKDEYTGGMQCA